MKKIYDTPQAVVFNTLKDVYCAELNISVAPDSAGTTVGGYGDTHATVDGSGLLD